MPKSKNKKDHKKRSKARTQNIKGHQDKMKKMQNDMIMEMIRKEQEKGAFNDLPTFDPIGGDINLDGPLI